uniref:Reverse transcriptase domain-containing protein n=1 Tax=Tanacetum cinerariifolium TaxID=118510 RepID=A0A6L2NW87_TANCI|nr:hypothetical protein [Tanacetum cinerariifolium]
MQMLYCFINNVLVDYDELLWEGLHYYLTHPTTLIPYPRFANIIVDHYMTENPNISRRDHDNYHKVKNDNLFRSIFNSEKNKEGEGIESSVQDKPIVIRFRVLRRPDLETPIPTAVKIDITNLNEATQVRITRQRNEFMEDIFNDQKEPDTRIEPKSDKQSPEAKKSVDVLIIHDDKEKEGSTGDEFELKRRETKKGIEDTMDTLPPTPIRSLRTHIAPLSTNKETLQELMVSAQDAPSSLDKEKLKEFTEVLPLMVNIRVNEIAKKTVSLYVADGLLFDRQKTQADVVVMIAKAVQKECENLRTKITLQDTNAIANSIPLQSLKIKFEKHTTCVAPCRTVVVRTRDHEDHHNDNALPEGERSAKRQKMSEHETYLVGESLLEQVMEQEPNPLGSRSISTWEDLTTRFLDQLTPSRRTAKLQNDILMFQQHQVKAISLPQDVLSTSDPCLIELENQVQCLMEAHRAPKSFIQVNKINSSCIAHAPIYNDILDKYVESLELGKNGYAFIQGKMPKKVKDSGLFTLPCRLGNSEPFDTLADLGSCMNLIPLYLFKKLMIGLLEEADHVLG